MKQDALKDKNVLYLDFDGVLHHSAVMAGKGRPAQPYMEPPGFSLFQYENVLVDLIKPTNTLIVLSTSWANLPYHSTNWAKAWLCEELRERVVGRTADIWVGTRKFRSWPRGHQVWAHARQFKPNNWVALDDDDSGFDAKPFNFIKTHWETGICAVKDQLKYVFDTWSNV